MKKISLYLAAFTIAALGLMPASSFAQDEKAEKKAKRAEKKNKKTTIGPTSANTTNLV
jgi:hypothetical protein